MSSITAVSVLGLNDHPRYFFFRENDIVRALALQGWPDEAQSDPWQAEAAARDTLARWVASGLPVHYINGQHAFDIGHVLNFMRLRGLEGLHTPQRFRVIHRREFNLTGHPPAKMVRLRVPLPYEDLSQRDIRVSTRSSEASELGPSVGGGTVIARAVSRRPRHGFPGKNNTKWP